MIANDSYINLVEAAALLPPGRAGARVHPATLTRWILSGVRAVGGNRVKLRAVRCGSRWLTTREWLEHFLAECAGTTPLPPAIHTPVQRRRDHDRATKELEKMGI
jgi:hypothetical protein